MIKLVAMAALASAMSHGGNSRQLSGEYFYNTKIGFESLQEGQRMNVSSAARSFCAGHGYNSALAFYIETATSPKVTDIFCSNLRMSKETVIPARVVIARERNDRGLPLREDVRNLLEKTEHLRFSMVKKTDASSVR
jgi:hypothetical protein